MPNRPELSLLIFNGPTSATVLEELTPIAGRLRFSTMLHGGFNACSFMVAADRATAWASWVTERHGYRVAVCEGARTIWEGRKEDVALTAAGVEVTCLGYWANLGDFPHLDYSVSPPSRVTYSGTEHADDVFKDVLAKLPNSQISADQSGIARPDLQVASAAKPLAFTGNETGQQVVMTVANWSDSGNAPWYAAIWEERKAYLSRRDTSRVTWHTTLDQIEPGWRFRLSFGQYASDVYADYLSGGASALTALAYDEASRGRYGRRVKALSIGRETPAGVATQARDTYLDLVKRPRQQGGFAIQGAVFDAYRAPAPLWRVRAGDVLRIDDLAPATADLDAVTLDGLRTFYLVETEYDHTSNTLRMRPDTASLTLPRILQREGIAG